MDILGQPQVIHYLTEGIKLNRLSPSLLFAGPDGTGKRSCSIELAKCFVCENPQGNAGSLPRCGRCRPCLQAAQNNHADILFLDRTLQATLLREKPESQTAIKIEAVRHADKFVSYKPLEGRRRMVIIDEAHKLTNESANALLKLLEEPPNNAQLVLLATNERTLPSTVLSRCAILRFRPIPAKVISAWLEKEYAVGEETASNIANRASGSFEKALALKDEDAPVMELADYNLDEFFQLLAETNWRKEGRKTAESAVNSLIASAQKKMDLGDLEQVPRLQAMLSARTQLDRHVPPKLVLENLFLKLEGVK